MNNPPHAVYCAACGRRLDGTDTAVARGVGVNLLGHDRATTTYLVAGVATCEAATVAVRRYARPPRKGWEAVSWTVEAVGNHYRATVAWQPLPAYGPPGPPP